MIVIAIDTSNAAFEDDAMPGEVCRLLAVTCAKVQRGMHLGTLLDSNGNRCGAVIKLPDDATDSADALGAALAAKIADA